MTQLRRFELTRSKARDNVFIVGLLLVLLIVMGSLSFWWLMNDQHHTVLDAFYFTIVSITTVGLGDIVPSSGPSMILYYFFMSVSLGMTAMFVTALSILISSGNGIQQVIESTKAGGKAARDARNLERQRSAIDSGAIGRGEEEDWDSQPSTPAAQQQQQRGLVSSSSPATFSTPTLKVRHQELPPMPEALLPIPPNNNDNKSADGGSAAEAAIIPGAAGGDAPAGDIDAEKGLQR